MSGDHPKVFGTQGCAKTELVETKTSIFHGPFVTACVIPARPRKAKDKAKAEAGALIASRWVIAALK